MTEFNSSYYELGQTTKILDSIKIGKKRADGQQLTKRHRTSTQSTTPSSALNTRQKPGFALCSKRVHLRNELSLVGPVFQHHATMLLLLHPRQCILLDAHFPKFHNVIGADYPLHSTPSGEALTSYIASVTIVVPALVCGGHVRVPGQRMSTTAAKRLVIDEYLC